MLHGLQVSPEYISRGEVNNALPFDSCLSSSRPLKIKFIKPCLAECTPRRSIRGSPNQGQCCQRIYVQCYRHRNIPDVSPQQSERDSADDATISVNATSTYALCFPVNSPHDHCILRTGAPNGQTGRTAIPGSKWTIASFVAHVVTHELDDRSFGSKPPRTDSAVV